MAARILYNNNFYTLNKGENVLECLLRGGQRIPHSCKEGVCQSCIMKLADGEVPEKAQNGLKPTLKQQKYFLACQCYPDSDIEVLLCESSSDYFYVDDDKQCPIILVGVSGSITPLYSIVLDALGQGHHGDISFYHNVIREEDLSLVEELKKLSVENDNFTYIPCVLNRQVGSQEGLLYKTGNLEDIVMDEIPENSERPKFYLCGAPELINSLRVKIFLSGISPTNIYVDAFLPSNE